MSLVVPTAAHAPAAPNLIAPQSAPLPADLGDFDSQMKLAQDRLVIHENDQPEVPRQDTQEEEPHALPPAPTAEAESIPSFLPIPLRLEGEGELLSRQQAAGQNPAIHSQLPAGEFSPEAPIDHLNKAPSESLISDRDITKDTPAPTPSLNPFACVPAVFPLVSTPPPPVASICTMPNAGGATETKPQTPALELVSRTTPEAAQEFSGIQTSHHRESPVRQDVSDVLPAAHNGVTTASHQQTNTKSAPPEVSSAQPKTDAPSGENGIPLDDEWTAVAEASMPAHEMPLPKTQADYFKAPVRGRAEVPEPVLPARTDAEPKLEGGTKLSSGLPSKEPDEIEGIRLQPDEAQQWLNERNGMRPAIPPVTMKKTVKLDEVAALKQQNLPMAEFATARNGAAGRFSSLKAATENHPEPLFQAAAMQSFDASFHHQHIDSEVAVRTNTLIHQLESGFCREVELLRQFKADSMAVVIRPDEQTQISLQLTMKEGEINIVARCDQGDFSRLAGQWHELQRNLDQQGIRLHPLNASGHAGTGQDRQPSTPHYPTAEETSPQTINSVRSVNQVKADHGRNASPAQQLLETWA